MLPKIYCIFHLKKSSKSKIFRRYAWNQTMKIKYFRNFGYYGKNIPGKIILCVIQMNASKNIFNISFGRILKIKVFMWVRKNHTRVSFSTLAATPAGCWHAIPLSSGFHKGMLLLNSSYTPEAAPMNKEMMGVDKLTLVWFFLTHIKTLILRILPNEILNCGCCWARVKYQWKPSKILYILDSLCKYQLLKFI